MYKRVAAQSKSLGWSPRDNAPLYVTKYRKGNLDKKRLDRA